MRRYGLGMLAIVSLLIAAVASLGYVAHASVVRGYTSPRRHFISTSDGVIDLAILTSPNSTSDTDVTYGTHFSVKRPNLSRCLRGFRYVDENIVSSGRVTAHWTIISLPVWCVLLACSIAPLMWIRRRRKKAARGFAVLPAEPTASSPSPAGRGLG